ncbi:TerB family tellurite resistance protein [Spirosoma foliorum]|uniref:TerB family tellurite resistance protein n=1 Tax=Spirosoma foliorum TaxID=2710596 RepID=A0A7G5H4Z2_9BACT|nr:TerB family tellurite resistance protein [Spirosoma foliorum]QMW06184.1 TerB family tellurite resistance protein [Spirosoma foliorum]
MYSPDLSMSLGSIVYALSKLDGRLHKQEQWAVKALLAQGPYGDLALSAFFLRENTGEPGHDAYAFGMRRLVAKRLELTEHIKKRFVRILLRVAGAHNGISPEERLFIRQFWRDIRAL